MKRYILALDCGSTNFKAAVFDDSLQRLAETRLPVPALVAGTERVELDAEAIWQLSSELIHQNCQQAGLEISQLTHIALTSQAQTFVLLDEQNHPLTPLISWLDRRAEGLVPQIQQALGVDFARHCSFTEPLAELQLAKLLWLKHNQPELLSRTCCIASLPTWLALCLGGEAVIDDNLAAMSGLYSLKTSSYWAEALELCGVAESHLPLVTNQTAHITLAGNDQTCGAFGNDCQENKWVATLGTALVAYRRAGVTPGPYHPHGCWGPYPGDGFYELAVQSYGCIALDWAHSVLFPGQDLAVFFTAAQSVRVPIAVQFYPQRMGTPYAWDGSGTAGEMTLAVLEGIGFALRSLLFDELGADARLEQLIVTGGGSRSDFWLQLLANILGVTVHRAPGDALLGAARLAYSSVKLPQVSLAQTWQPDPHCVGYYRASYERWKG